MVNLDGDPDWGDDGEAKDYGGVLVSDDADGDRAGRQRVVVIGCVLYARDDERLLQMAVAPRYQGKGVGRALVEALEAHIVSEGHAYCTLHARDYAIPFYERLGYAVYGDPFEEGETVIIPHRHMEKRFSQ